jgi:hypothetical protein
MWPYKTDHANIMFGEQALAFGVLLGAASFFLWRKHELFDDLSDGNRISEHGIAQIAAVLRPVSVWIFATGLMMASLTVAISYYQLGKAPPQEAISGLFSQSWIETAFLSVVWGLTSVGALLLPAAVKTWNTKLLIVAALCWRVAGAMNYFTHVGLLMNTSDSF